MWKSLRAGERALASLSYSRECARRTFLSEAYSCTEAWNKRLESPLLSKVKPGELFLEIDQKFQSVGKAHAVDVDIYANAIRGSENVEELVDVLHNLRLTPETSNTLESTHHAVVRYLLENDLVNDLMTILHDRINYGIFPDHHGYNCLMDAFIKKEDFALASKVAVLLMLQEDSEHPICNSLAVYSCHRYLENPETWTYREPEPEPDNGEEIKVRVHFIRNPFFDDHFDLRQPADLVGKTLVFFGKIMNDVLGRTCRLRGLVLWKKYVEATKLLDDWSESGEKEYVYKEVVPLILEHLSTIPEEASTDDVKELRTKLEALGESNLKEGSILEDIESRVRQAVETREKADIEQQCQTYEDWEKTRMSVLEAQLTDLDRKKRMDKVEQMKKELADRERFITFFDKRDEIELAIEKKLRWEKEKYGKRIKVAADIDENYVPPEVRASHNIKR